MYKACRCNGETRKRSLAYEASTLVRFHLDGEVCGAASTPPSLSSAACETAAFLGRSRTDWAPLERLEPRVARARVRAIMLCHIFLIEEAHTCELRSTENTCVYIGYKAAS